MGKVDNIQGQAGSISGEMETKKESKVNEKIKHTTTEMKNTIDGLVRRLATAEEEIRKFQNRSIAISQMEMQRWKERERDEEDGKNRGEEKRGTMQELWRNFKGMIHV